MWLAPVEVFSRENYDLLIKAQGTWTFHMERRVGGICSFKTNQFSPCITVLMLEFKFDEQRQKEKGLG